MADPGFYPDRPERVDVRETHVSWVFLAGERAFKLRKEVVFPFLDYGTPERRRHMCEEELRLGRRLAPTLYLGIRSVIAPGERFALAEADHEQAREHVVEMLRFDESRTLAALLRAGAASEDDVRMVARRIAGFHSTADPAPPESFGPSEVAVTVGENFTTLLGYADQIGGPAAGGGPSIRGRFPPRTPRGARGAARGRVHTRVPRRPACRARACSAARRWRSSTPWSSIPPCGWWMWLRTSHSSSWSSWSPATRISRGCLSPSTAMPAATPAATRSVGFYAAYRGWVRAKVACLRAYELADDGARRRELEHAVRLAALAEQLSWHSRRPMLMVVCGPSATGKTRLSEALADVSGLAHLNSDVVRKGLAGLPPERPAPADAYSEEASLRTYRELGARAAAALPDGGALVDATFRRRIHREAFAAGYGHAEPGPDLRGVPRPRRRGGRASGSPPARSRSCV